MTLATLFNVLKFRSCLAELMMYDELDIAVDGSEQNIFLVQYMLGLLSNVLEQMAGAVEEEEDLCAKISELRENMNNKILFQWLVAGNKLVSDEKKVIGERIMKILEK